MTTSIPACEITTRYNRSSRTCLLFAISSAIVLIWIVLLPMLGQVAPVREMIEAHERNSIDPSAMFYSELENLDEVLHRIGCE